MPKIWKNKDIEQRDKEKGEVGGGGEARGGNGEDEQGKEEQEKKKEVGQEKEKKPCIHLQRK